MRDEVTTTKSIRVEDITGSPTLSYANPTTPKDVKNSRSKTRGFEPVDNTIECSAIRQGTSHSAGYDVPVPNGMTYKIKPQEKVIIKTNIKAYMLPDEFLLADIRSSSGIKLDLSLANTLPIIDSDYYNNPDNGGDIMLCVKNNAMPFELRGYNTVVDIKGKEIKVPIIKDLTEANTVTLNSGDRFAQFIFVNYLRSDNCNSNVVRSGGIGSTGGVPVE